MRHAAGQGGDGFEFFSLGDFLAEKFVLLGNLNGRSFKKDGTMWNVEYIKRT